MPIAKRQLFRGELTRRVIGAFFETYNELGFGFSEAICAECLAIVFAERGISFDREVRVPVHFRGQLIGVLKPDFVVDANVIIELKAARSFEPRHEVQLLNYLRATSIEVGLLLNFGHKPEFRRLVYANRRKSLPAPLNRHLPGGVIPSTRPTP